MSEAPDIDEVIARAIAAKDGKSDRYWRDYHDMASAAIEALRDAGYAIVPVEPTEAVWCDSYIHKLNQLCEKHGCIAGSDRLEWLDEQLSAVPGYEERRKALREGKG